MHLRRIARGIKKDKPDIKISPPPKKEDDSVVGLNIVYPIVKPYSFVNIRYDDVEGNLRYIVKEPELSEADRKSLDKIENIILEVLDVDFFGSKNTDTLKAYMTHKIEDIMKKYDINISPQVMGNVMYYLLRDFIGFGKIDPIINDPHIEDISCDGVNIPIYIVHRSYGSMKTNVVYENPEELNSFVIKLAQWSGRHISVAEPLLDGALPDGSRVQATYGSDVTMKGSTFSIRKFKEVPLTPLDVIENGTVSSEMMAYFWLAVENRASVLVSGGTATGKTTLLNILSMFIRPESKIVSIEDTSELNLPHEHWIPSVARPGYGPPDSTGKRYGEISMFDLLVSSLRQRPDYIVVGEVRGEEAYVLFQGMATGHAGLSTIHSDSIESLIQRLQTPPINLSPALLESLDIIIFLTHARINEKPARRIVNVTEITGMGPDGNIETTDVFRWRAGVDDFEFTGRSQVLSDIITTRGEASVWLSETDIWTEVKKRKDVLDWMMKSGISGFEEVSRVIVEFYTAHERLLKKVYG